MWILVHHRVTLTRVTTSNDPHPPWTTVARPSLVGVAVGEGAVIVDEGGAEAGATTPSPPPRVDEEGAVVAPSGPHGEGTPTTGLATVAGSVVVGS